MSTPRPLDRPMISRMARAICDADPTMEDVKGGRRCRTFGCVEGSNRCIAFKQAAVVARLFDAMILDRPKADAIGGCLPAASPRDSRAA